MHARLADGAKFCESPPNRLPCRVEARRCRRGRLRLASAATREQRRVFAACRNELSSCSGSVCVSAASGIKGISSTGARACAQRWGGAPIRMRGGGEPDAPAARAPSPTWVVLGPLPQTPSHAEASAQQPPLARRARPARHARADSTSVRDPTRTRARARISGACRSSHCCAARRSRCGARSRVRVCNHPSTHTFFQEGTGSFKTLLQGRCAAPHIAQGGGV